MLFIFTNFFSGKYSKNSLVLLGAPLINPESATDRYKWYVLHTQELNFSFNKVIEMNTSASYVGDTYLIPKRQTIRRSFRETILNPLLVPVVLSLMFCWAPLLKLNGVGKNTLVIHHCLPTLHNDTSRWYSSVCQFRVVTCTSQCQHRRENHHFFK